MSETTVLYLLMAVVFLLLLAACVFEIVRRIRAVRAKGLQWLEDEGYITPPPAKQLRNKLDESYRRLSRN